MKFKYILFDLDGTLSASGPGITRSAQYALHCLGIEEPDPEKLTFFIGPPLNLTFHENYGLDDTDTAKAIAFFRSRYDDKGVFENVLYPGIPELLKSLKKDGHILAIASSKPDYLVHKVLEHFKIAQYFDVIVGSNPSMEADAKAAADNKEQMVRKALEELRKLGNSNDTNETEGSFCSSCAMVGDRFYDINGAKANLVTAVGVTYGYGTRKELEDAGADYICASVPELQECLAQ